MIIITGPGRSGTSFIARMYQELGFDPGGKWVGEIHGGLEPEPIVAANELILDRLGLTPMGAPGGMRGRIRRGGKSLIPTRYQKKLRERLRWLPFMENDQPGMLDWERFARTASELAPRLHSLSAQYPVTKDPRFFWTLPVWAEAGVSIEHVLLSVRTLDAVVDSRDRMDSIRFRNRSGAKNSIVYGFGLTMMALHDWRIAYAIVRFPDFLEDPEILVREARFPTAVSRERVLDVIQQLRRPELVHDHR